MSNFSEMLKRATTITEVKDIVKSLNDAKKDNAEFVFEFKALEDAVSRVNKSNLDAFSNAFSYSVLSDRKKAFADLLETPYFNVYTIDTKKNGTFEIKDGKKLFSFANLEKEYQLVCFTETNPKNGKPMPNKSVTVFDALRFYGLMSVFIRNLQKANFEVDTDKAYNLENVVIDAEKVFAENEGECFASNSNNNLEKQLNIIVKFFGYDVKMLKKDLPILKIKAQKIKQDKSTAKFSVNAVIDDNTILKFADVIFGVIASRINGEDITITTTKAKKEN
jgi:hypothetical protein